MMEIGVGDENKEARRRSRKVRGASDVDAADQHRIERSSPRQQNSRTKKASDNGDRR